MELRARYYAGLSYFPRADFFFFAIINIPKKNKRARKQNCASLLLWLAPYRFTGQEKEMAAQPGVNSERKTFRSCQSQKILDLS